MNYENPDSTSMDIDQPQSKKRKTGNTSAGGVAKGGAGNQDGSINPIPRHLPLSSVTVNFVQRTWEEIGPGELKYLPLSCTPRYMFDSAMLEQYNKFTHLWATMEIHQPHARISNLIMLQDDLINQGGTPMETTAFTQACYMMLWQPNFESDCFKLYHGDCTLNTAKILSYQLGHQLCTSKQEQLIPIGNQTYQDFENLIFRPYQRDIYAGPVQSKPDGTKDYSWFDPYIHPKTQGAGPVLSGNLQALDNKFVKPGNTVTWCRNTDKITLHKYGDCVDIPINTNLNGVKLLNHPQNYIFNNTLNVDYASIDVPNVVEYDVEFYYPSRCRPFLTRRDQLETTNPSLHIKDLSNLKHTFFTMPPIKKADGSLLKQRCSFMLEQEVSITFHFPTSMWTNNTDTPAEDRDADKNILNQDTGVLLRPNFYGIQTKTVNKPGCPGGNLVSCGSLAPGMKAVTPPDNTWGGILDYLYVNGRLRPLVPVQNVDYCLFTDKKIGETWAIESVIGTSPMFETLEQHPHIPIVPDITMKYPLNNLGLALPKFTQIWAKKYIENSPFIVEVVDVHSRVIDGIVFIESPWQLCAPQGPLSIIDSQAIQQGRGLMNLHPYTKENELGQLVCYVLVNPQYLMELFALDGICCERSQATSASRNAAVFFC